MRYGWPELEDKKGEDASRVNAVNAFFHWFQIME